MHQALLIVFLLSSPEPLFKPTGVYALPTVPTVSPDTPIVPYSSMKDLEDLVKKPPLPSPDMYEELQDIRKELKAVKDLLPKAPPPVLIPEVVLPKQPKTVTKPNLAGVTPYYENNRQTSNQHLLSHGADPNLLKILTPEEKNRLHGYYHGQQARVQVQSGGCPGGVCPAQPRFWRRR